MRNIFILFFCLICSMSIGGTTDPKKSDELYINYGNEFSCIFRIRCVTNTGIVYHASAVAIDDNWILTAAHVLVNSNDVTVLVGDDLIKIDKIISHKKFIESNYGYYDIALCHVVKSFDLNTYPKLYTKKDEVGKICSITGFGAYGTFETGSIKTDGKKRAGLNRIDSVDRQLLISTPSKSNSKDNTELEYMIANGDSGGGLFIDNKLAGINSCVMATDKVTNSNYGDEAGHIRISEFVEWIKENKK